MKPRISSLASTLAVAASLLAGCAVEEAEAGEAAYPPIGYTPPPSAPDTASPASAPAAAPAEAAGPAQPPPGAWQWAPPQEPPQEDRAQDGVQASPDDGAQAPQPDEGPGYADADPSALTDFRSTLDPYGTWVDDPTYGTVWVPSASVVGEGFTPYVTAGHWAYDSDYTWVSDYDWGWAPFHYGRWVYAQGPGWAWVPGRTYAGAWVSWRCGYDDWAYVGWAPLAPTWGWRGGVAMGLGFVPRAPYSFVANGGLFGPGVATRVVAGPQVGVIASHTRPYAPIATGRVPANPTVGSLGGPPPSMLRVTPDSVERTPATNRGIMQARAFAHPSTAVGLGARAPAAQPAAWAQGRAPYPAYRAYPPSHFGGRFGGGFAGNASTSPPIRSYGQGSYRLGGGGSPVYYGSRTLGGDARVAPTVQGGFRGGPSATFRSGGTGPAVHGASGPSFSDGGRGPAVPAMRGGGGSFGGGAGFRGGGGVSHGGGHGGGRR